MLLGAGTEGMTGGRTDGAGDPTDGEIADGITGCPIDPGMEPNVELGYEFGRTDC